MRRWNDACVGTGLKPAPTRNLALLFALCLLMLAAPLAAAPGNPLDAPLGSPLLAFDTAAQDRIVLYDVTGSTTRDLHFGTGWHHVWSFSPDGCRVLFTLSDGLDNAHAYTARLDGSDMRELIRFSTPPLGEWGVWEPQWSPDPANPRIAFTLIVTQTANDGSRVQQHRIAYVAPDGGEPSFYSVTGDEHTPRWSPDGQWLAYVSYEERPAGRDPLSTAIPDDPVAAMVREADLWVVGADGLNKTRRTDFPVGSVSMPRWSPDGDLIAFVFSPMPSNDQLWMMGSSPDALPTQLSYTEALALDLTWLPDSTALAAALRDFRGVSENRLWRIPLVGIADNDAVQLAGDPQLVNMDYPRFSPDGRWLAARSAYALVLIDMQNARYTLLDDAFMGSTPPVWNPVGFQGESLCQNT